jgi:hypothetical protein
VAVPAHIGEFQYVSRYTLETFEFRLHRNGVLANADAAVTAEFVDAEGVEVFDRTAANPDAGVYQIVTASSETAEPGFYTLTWHYTVTDPQEFVSYIEIGESAPAYDGLDPAFKDVVENVWVRFADMFDSPAGGPNLQSYFQSHFGRGRIAQLMQMGLNRVNGQSQPKLRYTLGGPAPFPLDEWGHLLEQATYVEVIKHLMRSYIEQPEPFAVNVARMDRKDYLARWEQMMQIEEQLFKEMLDTYKIRQMGLGGGRVLVGGGVYGTYGPTRLPASAVARPRFWSQFY